MIINLGHLKANLESTGRSAEEAIAELERELNIRIRMYPEWLKSRKLCELDAKDRLERLSKACQIVSDAIAAAATTPSSFISGQQKLQQIQRQLDEVEENKGEEMPRPQEDD